MAASVIEMPGTTSSMGIAPRAPISWGKSGNLDFAAGYYESAKAWRAAARAEALETIKLNPENNFIRQYIDFIEEIGRASCRERV